MPVGMNPTVERLDQTQKKPSRGLSASGKPVPLRFLSSFEHSSPTPMALGELEDAQGSEVAVVVVPYPTQGHLNQLLHLSLHLSSHGLSVHYASPPSHILQAKSRLQGWHPNPLQSIHFHDLPLPSFFTPPPKPGALSSHIQPLRDALIAHLRAPLASLLRSLSDASRRLIVIYDTLVLVAAQEAMALSNAEIYSFRSTPASFLLSFISAAASSQGKPDVILASLEGCFTPALIDFILTNRRLRASVEVRILINTCRPVEGEFIDRLARQRFGPCHGPCSARHGPVPISGQCRL